MTKSPFGLYTINESGSLLPVAGISNLNLLWLSPFRLSGVICAEELYANKIITMNTITLKTEMWFVKPEYSENHFQLRGELIANSYYALN